MVHCSAALTSALSFENAFSIGLRVAGTCLTVP